MKLPFFNILHLINLWVGDFENIYNFYIKNINEKKNFNFLIKKGSIFNLIFQKELRNKGGKKNLNLIYNNNPAPINKKEENLWKFPAPSLLVFPDSSV